MGDLMSATEVLARLRADAADERFDGSRLGPTAVRELLRHVDELAARLEAIERAESVRGAARLTDEQIVELRQTTRPLPGQWGDTKAFARAIEAAVLSAGPAAPDLAGLDGLRCERDELREQAAFVERHLGVIGGVLGSPEPIEIDDIAARLHLLIVERDELAARLAKIEAQKPVVWVRYLSDGSIQWPPLPDEKVEPVRRQFWTPLIAADWVNRDARPATAAEPVQAEPIDAELVAAEWPEGFEQAVQSLPTLADAVALFDEPAQAKPCRCRRCLTERGDLLTLAGTMILCPTCGNKRCPHATDHRHACTGSNEPGQTGSWYGGMPERTEPADGCGACGDACRSRASCRLADESPRPAAGPDDAPKGCPECGQLGWHKMSCSHVAHERGLRVTAQSGDSTSCPRGER